MIYIALLIQRLAITALLGLLALCLLISIEIHALMPEYYAYVLILIYVGGILVLFLFVIMLLPPIQQRIIAPSTQTALQTSLIASCALIALKLLQEAQNSTPRITSSRNMLAEQQTALNCLAHQMGYIQESLHIILAAMLFTTLISILLLTYGTEPSKKRSTATQNAPHQTAILSAHIPEFDYSIPTSSNRKPANRVQLSN